MKKDDLLGRVRRGTSEVVISTWPYEDIVDLPHHVSTRHPQMEMLQRAAQFAPFAALRGYEDAIAEADKMNEE